MSEVKRVEGPMTLGDALTRMVTCPGTMIQPPGRYLLRFWLTSEGDFMSPYTVCECTFGVFRDFARANPDRWYIVEEVKDSPDKLRLAQEIEGLKSSLAELEKKLEVMR